MDWARIKNILIILFLIINIFLCAFVYISRQEEKNIYNETADKIIAILEKQDIILDKKNIPQSMKNMKSCYIDRIIQSEQSFIQNIMGEYHIAGEGSYVNQYKSLTITAGDIDFKDTTVRQETINLSAMSAADINRYCKQNITKYGISLNGTIFKGINVIGDNRKAIFSYQYDKYDIIDAYVTVELSANGISRIQGKNIITHGFLVDEQIKVIPLFDILLDFPNNPQLNKSRKVEIINITQGYYIGKGAESYKSLVAIPVHQIVTDDGNMYHYDARNASFIE